MANFSVQKRLAGFSSEVAWPRAFNAEITLDGTGAPSACEDIRPQKLYLTIDKRFDSYYSTLHGSKAAMVRKGA